MIRVLPGIAASLGVVVKLVFGIVGAAVHLLLATAVGVGPYCLVRAARKI